jgi:hypothetical protein
VDQPQRPGIPACGIELNAANHVNAAIMNMGGGIIAIYGRADRAVRQIQAFDPSGHSTIVNIYPEPSSGERFFAVFVRGRRVMQFVAFTRFGRQLLTRLDQRLAVFLR